MDAIRVARSPGAKTGVAEISDEGHMVDVRRCADGKAVEVSVQSDIAIDVLQLDIVPVALIVPPGLDNLAGGCGVDRSLVLDSGIGQVETAVVILITLPLPPGDVLRESLGYHESGQEWPVQ